MKRCKRPTEPGYYLYHKKGNWEPVDIYAPSHGMSWLRVRMFDWTNEDIRNLKGWWGPKIGELDPK